MKAAARKIALIFGTRPEAIKLAPVILALREHPSLDCHVCVTAQHRHMLDQVLEAFAIVPDTDLDLMEPNQTLGRFSARALEAVDRFLTDNKPDLVLVQGDTTTVLMASLAAFYHKIPVGHVEAGLRTGDMQVALARGSQSRADDPARGPPLRAHDHQPR